LRDRPAVLALVAEEPGLVALRKVDLEAHAVFPDLHGPRRRRVGLVERGGLDALKAPEVVVHVHPGEPGAGQLVQQRQPARQPLRDAQAEHLAEENVGVPVDREAAQPVAVGIDKPVGVRLRRRA
jgi:hypothetical protein